MDVMNVIKARRSIRSFRSTSVPIELVKRVVEAGCWAPSGGNLQPWEFIIVTDPSVKERVVRTTYSGFDVNSEPQWWLLQAPVLIVACVDTKVPKARYGETGVFVAVLDVAMAVENILLEATSLGLGTCVVAGFREEELKRVLKIPRHVKPLLIVAVGYPERTPSPPSKRPVDSVIHFNSW
uniref:Nitroreductase family protein n=1 Tax=Fervidicoccus fontis TaxID=683846 RepID=A0A7J3ZL65_9CREN